jgi:two-component system, chemotaxis family, sensor kinase CheA
VEAGEILELLSEQLVQLEKQPDDKNLLNAIFRGFHTVKGGAGFLQLGAMVDCCHVTENLFDILRNGKQQVSPALMDVVLQALDEVNVMFDSVKVRQAPKPAPAHLLESLAILARGEQLPSAQMAPESRIVVAVDSVKDNADEITEDEFDQLLAALDSAAGEGNEVPGIPASSSASAATDDEISEEEFEALLDQMQGTATAKAAPVTAEAVPVSDEISDDEFEALLDQLHGGGIHQGVPKAGIVLPSTLTAPEKSSGSAPGST